MNNDCVRMECCFAYQSDLLKISADWCILYKTPYVFQKSILFYICSIKTLKFNPQNSSLYAFSLEFYQKTLSKNSSLFKPPKKIALIYFFIWKLIENWWRTQILIRHNINVHIFFVLIQYIFLWNGICELFVGFIFLRFFSICLTLSFQLF